MTNSGHCAEFWTLAERKLARPEGFEPPTTWFVGRCSSAFKQLQMRKFGTLHASRISVRTGEISG